MKVLKVSRKVITFFGTVNLHQAPLSLDRTPPERDIPEFFDEFHPAKADPPEYYDLITGKIPREMQAKLWQRL
jgi:hypothetical protein